MKKLLVLMMVLGIASIANAAIDLQISVNGDMNPVDSEITIAPSDHLVLDVWTNAIINQYDMFPAILVVNTAYGNIDYLTGGPAVGADSGMSIEHGGDAIFFLAGGTGLPVGYNGVGLNILDQDAGATAAGSKLFDEIDFHCVAFGDAIIRLYLVDENFNVSTLLDTVVIHQIPEPMTMALLGLGGLFLRRRK